MAIDLPPAIPPQLATVEFATQQTGAGDLFTGQVGNVTVNVYGNTLLSHQQIADAIAEAGNPSEAVLKLNQAYWLAGHLLVSLQYAVDGNKLAIGVTEGKLTEVIAPEAIAPFFEPLIGDEDLTRDEFEDARLLANLKSERAGQDITVRYHMAPNTPSEVTLVMESVDNEDHQATHLTATFGNPGNRYVGRYFGNIEVSQKYENGSKFSIGWERALNELSDDDDLGDNPRYDRYLASVDAATPLGLYGLSYNQTRFAVDNERSQIVEIEATGEQMLWRSDRTRISLREVIGHVEDETEDRSTGALTKDEPHSYVSVGATWVQRIGNFSRVLTRVSVKGGFEAEDNTGSTADSQFLLYLPEFGAQLSLFGNFWLDVDLLGQVSEDDVAVPRQQQWVLGGMSSLNAWLPGVLSADEGFFGRTSLVWRGNPVGKLRPTLAAFYEYGYGEDADGSAEGDLSDAGLRASLGYGSNTSLDIVAAQPIDDELLNGVSLDSNLDANYYFLVRHQF